MSLYVSVFWFGPAQRGLPSKKEGTRPLETNKKTRTLKVRYEKTQGIKESSPCVFVELEEDAIEVDIFVENVHQERLRQADDPSCVERWSADDVMREVVNKPEYNQAKKYLRHTASGTASMGGALVKCLRQVVFVFLLMRLARGWPGCECCGHGRAGTRRRACGVFCGCTRSVCSRSSQCVVAGVWPTSVGGTSWFSCGRKKDSATAFCQQFPTSLIDCVMWLDLHQSWN